MARMTLSSLIHVTRTAREIIHDTQNFSRMPHSLYILILPFSRPVAQDPDPRESLQLCTVFLCVLLTIESGDFFCFVSKAWLLSGRCWTDRPNEMSKKLASCFGGWKAGLGSSWLVLAMWAVLG